MFRLVLTTTPPEEAEAIADALVDEHLAASVNIIPGIVTKLRWKGAAQSQPEAALLIRTRAELVWRVERRIHELCSFEIPEVASIEYEEFNTDYGNWLMGATRPPK